MGLLDAKDWKAAWIGAPLDISQTTGQIHSAPLPLFRRDFRIDKPIAEAFAYVSGLGQYELQINGGKIGDAVLTPGWTAYRKTIFYNTYDITKALHQGTNGVGLLLGNGMYNVKRTAGRYTKFAASFGSPKLIFQAWVQFTDGSSVLLVSDSSWHCHGGPITFSSPYGGEDYDARLEAQGWGDPGFDDQAWKNAVEVQWPGATLETQENSDIRVQHVYPALRVTEPKPGLYVYDLGQNFSGWPEITVRGTAGSSVKLKPGELLDANGLVQQTGSGGPQRFSYTLKGSGVETWHPRFSYYGFRFVQVELQGDGQSPVPIVSSVAGEFIHADVAEAGTFRCANELFNRIHRLINAAILSNTQSVLTDCPHREKLGWLEQTHLLASSVMYNYDVSRLYEKISDDMRDTQAANGFLPEIAPEYVIFPSPFRDSPEWGSAIVLDPWLAFQHYGTARDIADHYEGMKLYANYLGSMAKDHIVSYGLGDWYDIGPGEPGVSKLTSLGVTATATYYADLVTLVKEALLLNRNEDAEGFNRLAEQVRQAFNEHFYSAETHVYDRGSQTDYAMPLALGLVPEPDTPAVLEKLVDNIRQHQNHVTAGDIGFHFVVEALTNSGRSDVVYDILSRTDAPSYGYQLEMGATTLTEAWDANPRHSQNHFMLGHAEEWFYRGLAGIDFDLARPEGEKIIIRPSPVGAITSASATYHSVVGEIGSSWKIEGREFLLDVIIPPNAAATIYLPTSKRQVFRVGSGNYHFSAQR
jgi:hypothetical protein